MSKFICDYCKGEFTGFSWGIGKALCKECNEKDEKVDKIVFIVVITILYLLLFVALSAFFIGLSFI